MAHHSSERFDDKTLAEIFGKPGEKLTGKTGKFPLGKLTENDEGELRMTVGHKDGKVVIDFGTPTVWIGFTPDQADEIAALLSKRAAIVRNGA